ncbi:unnamed protein product [Cuscuta epithymum]|uniref:Glucan endo-1,3-beta-D-glucosidase n=1 Tax=Cuscuta epithymum TaxID=186058 RepID=A0AAV0DUZ8_9ASTE|nr:unnamed protein product [Cuscuta epithymum]CAH9142532.1 unnamed protein product [Cuscuta epithymum]
MASTTPTQLLNATIMLIAILASLHLTVGQIGVYYGRNGDNLPPPAAVVALYKRNNIQRMRIYEPHHPTLDALKGSNIELTMSVPNINDLQYVAAGQVNATQWVKVNVCNYFPAVKIKHIVVGNEISPIKNSQYTSFVLPALRNVQTAITAAGLSPQIKVTTGVDTGVLGNSFPPQNSSFRPDVVGYLAPIIRFLSDNGSPLFVSIYPYFSYVDNPGKINLQYALLQPNSGVVAGGVYYDNLYYALVDAMYAAMEKVLNVAGAASSSPLYGDMKAGGKPVPAVKGGESGWPSNGGGGPHYRLTGNAGAPSPANADNAMTYNNNLVRIVKKGTPKRPNQPIETYIFAMFDEDLKQPPGIEQHFGLFSPTAFLKYPMNFN